MRTIEITEEEYLDRLAADAVKSETPLVENNPLFWEFYDIHKMMYPIHDLLIQTTSLELKAYLGEVLLRLNAMRARMKGQSRTYG